MKNKISKKNRETSPFSFLPAVDALLSSSVVKESSNEISLNVLTAMARLVIEELRHELRENPGGKFSKLSLLDKAEHLLRERFVAAKRQKLVRVINATGVILHTNLGRAPLAEPAKRAITEIGSGYCTLEYDLETGRRGERRGRQAEDLLCELTGAEAALVVNNCAAAAFLVLSALGAGGEAIVSRGELVEIGGDFRVPEVMTQSGTRLVEVGTTNRTKSKDFADAINENTKLLVRVHPSNFRIIGFTAMPNLQELAELAHDKNLLLYEDAGSGALVDLSKYGLADEPVIAQSIKAGADVVTFSGDKLLGGVQAGLIVGKTEIIERLRRHPLYRALRIDKTSSAALAATLAIYGKGQHFEEIPVLRMLSQTKQEIEARAAKFIMEIKARTPHGGKTGHLRLTLAEDFSAVGGGSAPLTQLPTWIVVVTSDKISVNELERRLRFSSPPIIARVSEDKILLDLRTVSDLEADEIHAALGKMERDDC